MTMTAAEARTGAGERAPLRVAVLSPHAVVRAGLVQLVQASAGRAVVVAADRSCRLGGVDVVVHDLTALAGRSGSAELQHLLGAVAVVGMARDERPHLEDAARAAGVRHLVPESVTPEALLDALELAAGRRAAPSAAGETSSLTGRELQVLALIGAGLSNRQIADQLFVSGNTVKTYVRQAYRKVGVTTRSQAVLWAVRHGVLPTDG